MQKTLSIMIIAALLLTACSGTKEKPSVIIENTFTPTEITTFKSTGDPICRDGEKPIVRLYSTSWCPHCAWVKETYDSVVQEYVNQGKIVAYHWEIDTADDLLTPQKEAGVPEEEITFFKKYNPEGSIPTFVMGCKYARVGNGYETQQNLVAEEAEFRLVIEDLLNSTKNENQ